MASTSLDLSQIKTDALSAASTFRTLIGLGNVNNTSDANKPISSATQSALDGKLSLTGGTLTGAVTSNLGTITASTPAVTINQTWNNAATTFNVLSANVVSTASAANSNWINFFSDYGGGYTSAFTVNAQTGAIDINSTVGMGSISLGSIGMKLSGIYATGLVIRQNNTLQDVIIINNGYSDIGTEVQITSAPIGWSGLKLRRDAADTLALQRGANAQRFNLYGTYTDASNYRRLYLSSTTAGAFTIGVEGAGTGASGNTLTVPNVLYVTDKIVHRTTNYDLVRLTSSGGEGVINIGNNTSASAANIFTSIQSNILNIQVSSNIALYANNGMTFLNSAGTARSGINAGVVDFTQPVSTSGSPTAFTLTGAAHTTLTASTEATDVNFNLARTVQFAAGALTTQRAFRIQAPTYSFASASTITTASTLSISGAPVAGTNATITNSYALNVEGGTSNFGPIQATTGTFSGDINGSSRLIVSGSGGSYGIGTTGHLLQFPLITGFLNLSMGTRGTGFSDRCQLHFQAAHNMQGFAATSEGFYVGNTSLIGFSSGNQKTNGPDVTLYRDAADTLALQRSTNAQRFNLYGTYTDASNYRRLYISSTTAGAFTLGVEGAGTGASGNTLTIPNDLSITGLSSGTTPLSITNASTNVTTFSVLNTNSGIGWAFQVGGSNPLTGAPAGSFTFRQTINDINTGIIASDGRWLIGSGNPIASTQLAVVSRATSNIVIAIRGTSGQSANLQEWQNNAGAVLASVSSSGALSAVTKSFLIDHPTKPGRKLQYGSLESPYHGIRLTGRSFIEGGIGVIDLPDYVRAFVSDDVNIQLTPVGRNILWVDCIDLNNNQVIVGADSDGDFYWSFTGIRTDVELEVEPWA